MSDAVEGLDTPGLDTPGLDTPLVPRGGSTTENSGGGSTTENSGGGSTTENSGGGSTTGRVSVVEPGDVSTRSLRSRLDIQDARVETPYAAVLWDMDGTLVDTEPYWMVTEHELAERHGGTWTQQDSLNLVGNDLLESGRYIREHMGIDLEPAEIVEQLLDGVIEQIRAAVPWRPGAVELLVDLGAAGVPCALVTMSYRRFVEPILAGLPDGTFAAVVTGDAVERGKPYPDPYVKAARLLGVDPAECLAIEDSNTGARSAETAGCSVLCVPNHVPILEGERRMFADTLGGLTAANLPVLP